jgi:hypothetical protein
VERRHPLGKLFIHSLVLVKPLAEHRVIDRLAAREHEAAVVLCDPHDELGSIPVEVVLLHPAEEVGSSHAGKYDSVLDFTLSYLPGCEERIESCVHIVSSVGNPSYDCNPSLRLIVGKLRFFMPFQIASEKRKQNPQP